MKNADSAFNDWWEEANPNAPLDSSSALVIGGIKASRRAWNAAIDAADEVIRARKMRHDINSSTYLAAEVKHCRRAILELKTEGE